MRVLAVAIVVATLVGGQPGPLVAQGQGPVVALITAVEGQAVILPGEQRALPFQWLTADSRLATGPRSTVVITFATGTRVRVKARSRVTVIGNQVIPSVGGVDGLPEGPAFPVRKVVRDGPSPEPDGADKALHQGFVDTVNASSDPELLLLGAAVQLQWGLPAEAAALLDRATSASAPPKLVDALRKQVR